ncbi:MAG: PH domain-containing protein [Microbacteriaceae bacterium]|nr:PH domain-containing protein [Microbacteriaceae bacterium]
MRGARDPNAERVVATLHSHGRRLLWPTIVLIADLGAATFVVGRFAENRFVPLVIAAAVLVALVLWLLPLLSWLSRRYTITTRRVVLREGFFVRTRQELLHSRGYDVTVRKHALQAIFGSGDVLINTGLDRPVILRDVPSADLVQSSLHELMEMALNPIAARRLAQDVDDATSWGQR